MWLIFEINQEIKTPVNIWNFQIFFDLIHQVNCTNLKFPLNSGFLGLPKIS